MDNVNKKIPLPGWKLGCIIKFNGGKEKDISAKIIGFYLILTALMFALYFIGDKLFNNSMMANLVSTIISLIITILFARKINKGIINYGDKLKVFFDENFDENENDYYIKAFKLEKDAMPLMGIIISLISALILSFLTNLIELDKSWAIHALDIKICMIAVFISIVLTSISPNIAFYGSMIIDLENISKKQAKSLDERSKEISMREKEIDEKEIIAIRYTNKMR